VTIDFRNTNTIWASILVETLARLGLTTAIVCPGSRSTPLTVAFAQHTQIEAIPVLDERSAAFFALGIARRTHRPVVLVCTSGTAGANFYPAVIEAWESRVPLLILTADRPPELRHCHSGQTIDQQKLFGTYPNGYAELALPGLDINLLAYLRQTLIHAWDQAQYPTPGPVHLNLPFRDPLAPTPQPEAQALAQSFPTSDFFAGIIAAQPTAPLLPSASVPSLPQLFKTWQQCPQGLIIAGPAQPPFPEAYCQAIAHLSHALQWPVLAEGLSPLRNYAHLNSDLISTYDLILRRPDLAQTLAPRMVLQIGPLPTSKELRQCLVRTQPQTWVVDGGDRNLDPIHGKTIHLHVSPETLVQVNKIAIAQRSGPGDRENTAPTAYLQKWCQIEQRVRAQVNQTLVPMTQLFEGKVAWLLSQVLPEGTPLYIANSMPVRDVEFFWQPNPRGIQPFFNRGANGIDGTLSTALGVMHRYRSGVLLTGDLALLHDTNGFLIRPHFVGHLTIVLINNNGGGIFEMLPIADFEPPFEHFFATPQSANVAKLCAAYQVDYELIISWEQMSQELQVFPDEGIRVLEVRTDRKADSQWRQLNLGNFTQAILEIGLDLESLPG